MRHIQSIGVFGKISGGSKGTDAMSEQSLFGKTDFPLVWLLYSTAPIRADTADLYRQWHSLLLADLAVNDVEGRGKL